MFRSNWGFIFAAIIGIAIATSSYGQVPSGSNQIAQKAQGTKPAQKQSSTQPSGARTLNNGEKAGQPDCGTPKECRAEQREKDDLIAQQVAAKAAADQANLSRWQTAIASVGVLAVIATLIYTHLATRSAVRAVEVVTQAEKAMLSFNISRQAFEYNSNGVTFGLHLSNVGKTVATLIETSLAQSGSNDFAEFKPRNVKSNNLHILSSANATRADGIPLFPQPGSPMFLVGYYKWKNQFEKRIYCDHFCYPIRPDVNGQLEIGAEHAAGWPPDSV